MPYYMVFQGRFYYRYHDITLFFAFCHNDLSPVQNEPPEFSHFSVLPFEGRIRLLDVGSCFNPFQKFPDFLSIGLDISPAVEVKK